MTNSDKRINLMTSLMRYQIRTTGTFDPAQISKIVDKIIPKDKEKDTKKSENPE